MSLNEDCEPEEHPAARLRSYLETEDSSVLEVMKGMGMKIADPWRRGRLSPSTISHDTSGMAITSPKGE